MICDKDGVPLLIQRLRYLSGTMHFEVTLFSGDVLLFTEEATEAGVRLMQHIPTHMQWLQAENYITKHVLENWVCLGLGQGKE